MSMARLQQSRGKIAEAKYPISTISVRACCSKQVIEMPLSFVKCLMNWGAFLLQFLNPSMIVFKVLLLQPFPPPSIKEGGGRGNRFTKVIAGWKQGSE